MKRWRIICAILLVLAGALTACQAQPKPDDPLPDQAKKILKEMFDDNSIMTEYSGLIVISQSILQYDADHTGTRGSLCDQIGQTQPYLEDKLNRETEQKSNLAADYQRMSSQVDDLKKTLKCDQLPSDENTQ